MAGKVPVGGTLAHAYSFAFGNIVNNLGLIWIPVAILWTAAYFLQAPYLRASMASAGPSPSAALAALPMLTAFLAVNAIVQSAQIASLNKEALGLRTGNAFLQFPFGPATWRVLGAFALYFIVMIIIYIGLSLASILTAGLSTALLAKSGAVGAVIGATILLGFLGALLYVGTRLSFFLVPVAIVERRVSLIRAWQLTGGNFWRIFFVLLVLFVPFLILELYYLFKLLGPFFQSLHANMTPQELRAWQQHFVSGTTGFSQRWWFVTYPVGVLVTLILYGMYAGASAHAYRAVTYEDHSLEVF